MGRWVSYCRFFLSRVLCSFHASHVPWQVKHMGSGSKTLETTIALRSQESWRLSCFSASSSRDFLPGPSCSPLRHVDDWRLDVKMFRGTRTKEWNHADWDKVSLPSFPSLTLLCCWF